MNILYEIFKKRGFVYETIERSSRIHTETSSLKVVMCMTMLNVCECVLRGRLSKEISETMHVLVGEAES